MNNMRQVFKKFIEVIVGIFLEKRSVGYTKYFQETDNITIL